MVAAYNFTPTDVAPVETENRIIKTQLPVPESLAIIEKLRASEPQSMQGQPPIIWDKAQGYNVYDKWGNKWLDFSAGVLITNVGHNHPRIKKALLDKIEQGLLSTYVFMHEDRATLTQKLADLSPEGLDKVFLLTTGSEAIENVIKLCKTYGISKGGPKKNVYVTFSNAFHGRTMGSQLAGGIPALKEWMPELDPSFVQVPFPDDYIEKDISFDLFKKTLEEKGIKPENVCGVMTESYQGRGPFFLPKDYAQELRKWCDENDAMLVMDEVQAGFGRSGKFYSFEHYEIVPDFIVCGKGISSSLPISAVIGRKAVMDTYPPGSMTSTHSASPLPVASAIANLEVLVEENLTDRAAELGKLLKERLEAIGSKYGSKIGKVLSYGLVAGLLIVKEGTLEPDAETALRINEICFRKGLLMFAPVGIGGGCIKLAPPLNIAESALIEGLDVLAESFDEVLG
ncbi:MAG: aspartate aminotransferase family protein [Planctomycetota bacterium]|nr:MAG: aspartate aminotransferase family protein [Planctomycetota bacterium]